MKTFINIPAFSRLLSLVVLSTWSLCRIILIPDISAAETTGLVVAFQKQKDPAQMKPDADKLAAVLTKKLQRPVTARIPTDYGAVVQAMVSGHADVAYLDSMAFLLAKRDGEAEILLAEERPDAAGNLRTDYDSVFVASKQSDINDVQTLVRRSKELRMVFTSPTSTSGYLMAYRRLVKEGLLRPGQDAKEVFKSVHFGGGYSQAIEEVLKGRGDVAAVSFYAVEGPSAKKYLTAEQLSQIKVIGRTSGVPTHVVAVRKGLPPELKAKVKQALLEVAKENSELLADVYGAGSFREVSSDTHVEASKEALSLLGIPLDRIVPLPKS